jgi:Uma2 family endonuclease
MQPILGAWFHTHARQWRIQVPVSTRTRVTNSKVRLPDLVVVPFDVSAPQGALESPPLIAIEVLSPDDSYNDLRQRARDLRAMGTANIWLIDPAEKPSSSGARLTWQPFQGDKLQATGIAAYLDPAWLWTEFA